MRAVFTLLALASSTLAQGLQERWYSEPGHSSPPETDTTTWTTYTSTTICPVTSTTTEKGTTKWITSTTTSTVVITSCVGGCGGIATVPGPTGWETTTTDVTITYTSTCPVTQTVTAPGTTYTNTYTTTSIVETVVPTTIINTITAPPHTASVETEVIETVTSLCPITETTTIGGKEVTVTYTTTSTYITHVPTKVEITATGPDHTASVGTEVIETVTSLCPITETTTIGGKETTITYTTTSTYTTKVPTHVQVTATAPGKTETAITGIVSTITSLCPITETKTISGIVSTTTYTSTSYIVTNVPTEIETSVTLPGKIETAITEIYSTITSLCPITETKTFSGSVTTIIYTTTSYIITKVPTIIETSVTLPAKTTTVDTGVLQTITSLCPITEVQTISGIVYTATKTSTSLIVIPGYTTDYSQTTLPAQTKTIETYIYQTTTSLCPVTEVQTVSGVPITKVFTSTIVTQVKVPTNIVQYTTTHATEYETTDVYETTTCIESVYTTISAGETIILTATKTNTIQITAVRTKTWTLPAATGETTVYVPTTIGKTQEIVDVVTVPSIVKTLTIPVTYWANTTHVQTSTIVQPSTLTVGGSTLTVSGQVTGYNVQPSVEISKTTPVVSVTSTSVAPSAPVEANAAIGDKERRSWMMGVIMGVVGLILV